MKNLLRKLIPFRRTRATLDMLLAEWAAAPHADAVTPRNHAA